MSIVIVNNTKPVTFNVDNVQPVFWSNT